MTFVARTQRRYQQETRTYHSPGSGTPEPIAGEWGHLRLLQEIGRGGFGSVYRAFDPTLEREVALKVFHTVARGAEVLAEGRQLAKGAPLQRRPGLGVDEHDGRAGLWHRGRLAAKQLRSHADRRADKLGHEAYPINFRTKDRLRSWSASSVPGDFASVSRLA